MLLVVSVVLWPELIRHKFLNLDNVALHLCSFQITRGMKQCTMCQCTKYCKTFDLSKYLKHKKEGWPTIVEDDPKAPFSIATTPRCRGEH